MHVVTCTQLGDEWTIQYDTVCFCFYEMTLLSVHIEFHFAS